MFSNREKQPFVYFHKLDNYVAFINTETGSFYEHLFQKSFKSSWWLRSIEKLFITVYLNLFLFNTTALE